jgi:hypothetical protein
MELGTIWDIVQQVMHGIYGLAAGFIHALAPLKDLIVAHCGQTGLIAAYVALAVIGIIVVQRLMRITFAVLKYLVVPSVGLAFLGTLLLPLSFAFLLPITVTLCSLLLLLKA